MVAITLGPQPSAPGGTATQEFPPCAAEWRRLRLPNFSVSTLSALYIENRKPGAFFLYIFHDVVAIVVQRFACAMAVRLTCNRRLHLTTISDPFIRHLQVF